VKKSLGRKSPPAHKNGPNLARKQPRQERSRALVGALLEATARILVQDGWDALTTNRVAREAGVSVGSLYQYFPGRDALVRALLESWADNAAAQLAGLQEALATQPMDTCVERVVAAALDLSRGDERLHRAVMLHVPRVGALDVFERLNRRASEMLAEWIAERRTELQVEDPTLTAHLLVTTLDALTDHALLFRPEWLHSRRFERELRCMVARTLGLKKTQWLPGTKA
jgi:AcrR family transcriptional regulator